jgi:hypothetical protein
MKTTSTKYSKQKTGIRSFFKGWQLAALAAVAYLSPALADTTFVNLSDESIRVARYFYTDGNSGNYREPGWVFKGWTVLESGESWVSESDHFYLERRNTGKPVTWADQDTSTGYVKYGGPFEGFLPRGGDPKRRLLDNGYKAVTFRKFEDKLYKTSAEKWRLAEKETPFNYESRSRMSLNGKFTFPGKVISIEYDVQERGAKNIDWKISGGIVYLNGSIEGRQTSPFAPREKAYYNGTLRVKYIAPR